MTVPTATIAAQGQGTFDVTAMLTDAAGNASLNSAATAVTVDTSAPTAVVAITAIAPDNGTSSSDYITNATTLTVSGTHGVLGTGETVQVSSDGGTNWADVTTSTSSTWSYSDPTTHATSFTYQARVVGTAGNVGANTASQAVTIDTAAPAAPSITSIPENSGGGINASEASDGTPVVVGLTGTGAISDDTLTINWGGQTVNHTLLASEISGSSATVTVPTATIAAQGQGTFNVTALLTDAAGNASAISAATAVTVDTSAPTAVVAITAIAPDNGTSSSDYITNATTLTVSGTHGVLGTGETVQVSSDGGASWADVTTSTSSTWSYSDPTTHATSFTYQARVVGTAGNVGADTASQAVTIDTAAPSAPSITSIPENSGGGINASEAADGTPVVVGLAGTGAAAGDTLTVNWGGQTVSYTLLASDISGSSATVTVPFATIATQGNGTFDVTALLTDAAGNASAISPATSVTVDTAAPSAPSITSIPENSGGGINAIEASDGTPLVVVGLTGTGAVAGDTLTVNWGSQTVNHTLLAAEISGNSATMTVRLRRSARQGTFNVTAI